MINYLYFKFFDIILFYIYLVLFYLNIVCYIKIKLIYIFFFFQIFRNINNKDIVKLLDVRLINFFMDIGNLIMNLGVYIVFEVFF